MDVDCCSRFRKRKRPLALQMVELHVKMDCPGCERLVRNALKIKGVESVEIDMEQQKVTVVGYLERRKVLWAVRRKGKKAEFWTFPYEVGTHYPLRPERSNEKESLLLSGDPKYEAFRESSYNYRKHGYTTSDKPPLSQSYGVGPYHDDLAPCTTLFSEDNVHACNLM